MSVDALTQEARDAFEGYAAPEAHPQFRAYATMAAGC
jgi:hypothetical protein